MEPLKQFRPTYGVTLRDLVQGPDAWGTDLGAKVFGAIDARLTPLSEGTLILVDFTGVARSDVSFQREAVVETLRKHRPRLLFMATNLVDPDLRANLDHALDRRGESLLVRDPDGQTLVIGRRLAREHEATLKAVRSRSEFTSGMLTTKPF